MNSPYSVVVPMLVLAALLGGFMTADKLWLHWYTPEAAGPTVERNAQIQPAGATPQLTAAGSAPVPSQRSRDAFAALWVASQQATYRVRYETSSASGEKGEGYLVFNLPPAARVDTIPDGADEPSSQLILDSAGSTFACSFDEGERSCGEIKAFDLPLPLAAGPIVFPDAASFASISVAELDSRTIVGAPTRCFRVLAADTADATDYCFNAETVPVYGNGPFGIVEASEVSSASDADFVVGTP